MNETMIINDNLKIAQESWTNLFNSGQAIYMTDCKKWCADQQFIRDFGGVKFLIAGLMLILIKYGLLVYVLKCPDSKIHKLPIGLIIFGVELLADVLIILFAIWMILKWKYQAF